MKAKKNKIKSKRSSIEADKKSAFYKKILAKKGKVIWEGNLSEMRQ